MAGEVGSGTEVWVTEVLGQQEDHVLVSLPKVGFPPGFELRAGDRVVLVHEGGPAVRPLVRAVTVHERLSESGEQLAAGAQSFVLQPATVRENEAGGPPYSVEIIERADGQGHVVAISSLHQ